MGEVICGSLFTNITSNVPVTVSMMEPGGAQGAPGTFTAATGPVLEQGVIAGGVDAMMRCGYAGHLPCPMATGFELGHHERHREPQRGQPEECSGQHLPRD